MTFWKRLFGGRTSSKTREKALMLTIPSKRLFSSDVQKSRQPIKDRAKFNEILSQFVLEQNKLIQAALGSKRLTRDESQQGGVRMLDLADRLVEMEPSRGIPWMCRCQALGALLRFSEALVALDHAIEIDPSDPEKWELRVTILKTLNKHEEAAASSKQLEQLRKGQ